MVRSLATARGYGRCPHKAALKQRGMHPNKLLSSANVQRMGVKSAATHPSSHNATEKIEHALEKFNQEEKKPKLERKHTVKVEGPRQHHMITRSMVKKEEVVEKNEA